MGVRAMVQSGCRVAARSGRCHGLCGRDAALRRSQTALGRADHMANLAVRTRPPMLTADPLTNPRFTLLHAEIPTHPDHKHTRDRIVASFHPSIEQVLQEVRALRSRARNQCGEGRESRSGPVQEGELLKPKVSQGQKDRYPRLPPRTGTEGRLAPAVET